MDDWEETAEAFTSLFSFTRALRTEYNIACVTTSSPGSDLSALLYHTHPHYNHTGIFHFINNCVGLEPQPLRTFCCLLILLN